MASSKNICIFLTLLEVGQSNTFFTFSSSILFFSSFITTLKNLTFLTFHLYFSSFIYRLFLLLFLLPLLLLHHISISFLVLFLLQYHQKKLTTSPVLIKSHMISFIIVWNIAGEFVSLKTITVSSNNLSSVINTAFYLSSFFIYTLLYSQCKSSLVNTFFILIFSIMSEIKDKG